MLQYIIIQLDDTSISFCHYSVLKETPRLISLNDLKAGVTFSMKNNLTIQFLYPAYILPQEYEDVIDSVDHCKIMPSTHPNVEAAEVVVFNSWEQIGLLKSLCREKIVIQQTTKIDFFTKYKLLLNDVILGSKLNIVFLDIETFSDEDILVYQDILRSITDVVVDGYTSNSDTSLNLLTHRVALSQMNNCNAGDACVTLAPDGKFYVCPAFYNLDNSFQIGALNTGLTQYNQHLYKTENAPLCRVCDAYQCRRCVYLNYKMTLEVNTPSREQCVVSHIERNASREMLEKLHKLNLCKEKTIKEIVYLDPFDVRIEP